MEDTMKSRFSMKMITQLELLVAILAFSSSGTGWAAAGADSELDRLSPQRQALLDVLTAGIDTGARETAPIYDGLSAFVTAELASCTGSAVDAAGTGVDSERLSPMALAYLAGIMDHRPATSPAAAEPVDMLTVFANDHLDDNLGLDPSFSPFGHSPNEAVGAAGTLTSTTATITTAAM